MNTYIQTTMFPDQDSQLIQITQRKKYVKKLPKETVLDLFPHKEKQLVFEDYFPSFKKSDKAYIKIS